MHGATVRTRIYIYISFSDRTMALESTQDSSRNEFPVDLRPNAGHGLPFLRFLDHTQRRITVGRTPLDE